MPIRSKDACCWLDFRSLDDGLNTKRERLIQPGMRSSPSKEIRSLSVVDYYVKTLAGKSPGECATDSRGLRNQIWTEIQGEIQGVQGD